MNPPRLNPLRGQIVRELKVQGSNRRGGRKALAAARLGRVDTSQQPQ